MHQMEKDKQLLSDAKFYADYSRMKDNGEYETWEEAVDRVMDTHCKKYASRLKGHKKQEFEAILKRIAVFYKQKRILGAQRALQFGGEQLLKHEAKMYNCASSYADRIAFFEECMYLLLCGTGTGFSVQLHHVASLPNISKPTGKEVVHHITDDIEGWSRAFYVLIASYFEDDTTGYRNQKIIFDYSQIRPKGAKISGGFKAPGSEGLQRSLEKCRVLMNRACEEGKKLRPIHVYDFVMHMADAVLSGGVRRSATICLFSPEDQEMMNAKTGTWYIDNPQRGRSNNSVILVRDQVTKAQWNRIIESVKSYGEPGFIFTDSTKFTYNPCVEIGMLPVDETTGESGWQMCVRPDTKLITRTGIEIIKNVADNKKEIEIWNGESWEKVTPFKTGTNQKFYRVHFSDGSYLDATANHKFAAKHRFMSEYKKFSTLELKKFIESSKYPVSIPRANIVSDSGIPNSHAYEYGFILGEGTNTCLTRSGKNLSRVKDVTFKDLDVALATKLKSKKGLPKDIFTWDKQSALAFIAGWADANGSQTSKGIRIYGTELDIRSGQLLLTKCGINSSVNLMSKGGDYVESLGTYRNEDVWYLQITQTSEIPCQRLVCDNKEEAKFKGKYQVITSIEPLEIIEDSYCLYEPKKGMCVFNNALTYQCNLTEINGGIVQSPKEFYDACWAASALGTIQAGYTNFKVMSEASKRIVEREALIGVSVTGWMDNAELFADKHVLRRGAEVVKETNAVIAELIGINPAARTTCVKPSGNASVLLGTASGIHGEHSRRYFRHMQKKANEEVLKVIKEAVPAMVEQQAFGTKDDCVIAFPIEVSKKAVTKEQLLGINQLKWVKHVQEHWVTAGRNDHLCTDPRLNHNVSNTITVDDWDEVRDYIFYNRDYFAGISLLASAGDKAYNQAPFTEVRTEEEIQEMYGPAAFFASGLVVDGLHAFDDLWAACDAIHNPTIDDEHDNRAVLKRDWVRRAIKFSRNYFGHLSPNKAMDKTIECLKDIYLLHKWHTITRQLNKNYPDFSNLQQKEYVDVNTLAGQACAGGVCEIV